MTIFLINTIFENINFKACLQYEAENRPVSMHSILRFLNKECKGFNSERNKRNKLKKNKSCDD